MCDSTIVVTNAVSKKQRFARVDFEYRRDTALRCELVGYSLGRNRLYAKLVYDGTRKLMKNRMRSFRRFLSGRRRRRSARVPERRISARPPISNFQTRHNFSPSLRRPPRPVPSYVLKFTFKRVVCVYTFVCVRGVYRVSQRIGEGKMYIFTDVFINYEPTRLNKYVLLIFC